MLLLIIFSKRSIYFTITLLCCYISSVVSLIGGLFVTMIDWLMPVPYAIPLKVYIIQ